MATDSVKACGWAARDPSGLLSPFAFSRRPTRDRGVQFKVLYFGICYSNLHTVKNDWGSSHHPLVPGHEMFGKVTQVGSKVQKFRGHHIGAVRLGELGHVAGVISSSIGKKKEAMESLAPDGFVISCTLQEMQVAAWTLDGIIDTVSAVHTLAPLLSLLKPHGKLIVVGAPEKPLELSVFSITLAWKTVAGSIMGGLKETPEMIDFAAKHNIVCDKR
ncbi:UNVERIFIED_CONTAM: 8-hydroxygeraniol dehydrogenase [Sesamum indicum]